MIHNCWGVAGSVCCDYKTALIYKHRHKRNSITHLPRWFSIWILVRLSVIPPTVSMLEWTALGSS